jgi:acetyl-CoA carboxylase carboxyltransferase component
MSSQSLPVSPVIRLLTFLSCQPINMPQSVGLNSYEGVLNNVRVLVIASNPDPKLGSIGRAECELINATFHIASRLAAPVVFLWSTSGARISEGAEALEEISKILKRTIDGRDFLMISLVLGATAGIGAYLTCLSEFSILSEDSQLFMTGPQLVKALTGKIESKIDIGGSHVHRKSGIPTKIVEDVVELEKSVSTIFNVLFNEKAIEEFSYKDYYASAIQLRLKRVGNLLYGETILRQDLGDPSSLEISKLNSFIKTCGTLHIPLVTFIDTRGVKPGSIEEENGALYLGAELMCLMSTYESFRLAIITGSSISAIHLALGSLGFSADHVILVPDSEISVISGAARELFPSIDWESVTHKGNYGQISEVTESHLLEAKINSILSDFR